MDQFNLTQASAAELLALRIRVDAELRARGLLRTAGPLVGELMERVVADAYGGTLAPPGTKSVDVVLADGRTIQVKARSLADGDLRFWSFGDLAFDLAVVISVDRRSGEILWARELTAVEVAQSAKPRATGGFRLRMGTARSLGKDVTEGLRRALAELA